MGLLTPFLDAIQNVLPDGWKQGMSAARSIGNVIDKKYIRKEEPNATPAADQTINVTGQATGGNTTGALASMGSGILSYLSGQQTNAANAKQAEQQMAFQNEQSRTGYQRTVEDLAKAGLNPMLAYSQGPESSMSGAQARMENAAPPAISSAMNALSTVTNAQLTKADTERSYATTDNIAKDTENKDANNALLKAQELKTLQETNTSASTAKQIDAAIKEIVQRTRQIELANKFTTGTQDANIQRERLKLEQDRLDYMLTRLGVPEATARFKAAGGQGDTSSAADIGAMLRLLNPLATGGASAASIIRAIKP